MNHQISDKAYNAPDLGQPCVHSLTAQQFDRRLSAPKKRLRLCDNERGACVYVVYFTSRPRAPKGRIIYVKCEFKNVIYYGVSTTRHESDDV
jgi:hypothetical protein